MNYFKKCYLAWCLLFVLASAPVAVAQDIFSDVPPDHWSRKTLEKLHEEGILDAYPDRTFKGDQVVTRYEMAAALAKILERLQGVESFLGGGTKTGTGGEDKFKDIQKLLKEYEPELKALKKMEDKIKTFEKDFQKLEKEMKKDKTDTKKLITDLKKDLKSTQRDVKSLQQEQGRITWSGKGTFSLSLTDNKAKNMEPLDKWGGGTCTNPTDGGCGSPAPSSYSSDTGFELNFQASPRLSGKTDRIIKLRAELRNLGRSLGDPVSNPSPTLGTFYVEYSAPRTKYRSLKVGDVSVGWSLLSLSILGVSFQGFKMEGILSKGFQGQFIGARTQKAIGTSGSDCSSPTSCKFAQYIYGMQLNTTYGNPPNLLWLHYLKNWDDKDSLFFTKEDVQKQYKPEEIEVYSAFTRYPVKPPEWGLIAELAVSKFKQWQKGVVQGSSPLDADDRKQDVPVKKKTDTAFLLELDYNKRGLSLASFYFRQNPDFRNRYGGPVALLGSFSGGVSLGGIDIGKFLSGGVQGYGFLNLNYSPPWAKGLTIKPAPLVYFTEVTATPLAQLIVELPKTLGVGIELTPDTDVNRRREKLGGFVMLPSIDFKPSFKTTFSVQYLYGSFGIPKHTVQGTGDLSLITQSGKGQVSSSITVLPPLIPSAADISDKAIGNKPTYFYPYFQYVNKNNDVMTGVIMNDGKVNFYRNPEPANIVNETPVRTENVNVFDPAGNGSVYIDAANVSAFCGSDNANCSYPTTDFLHPADGNYIFYKTTDGAMRLLRITQKTIELEASVANPSFKLTHQFSSKMKYELEGSQQEIKIKAISIALGNSPVEILRLINGTVKTEKTRTLNQHISYQLFNNLGLDFNYDMTFKDYMDGAGGHKEQTSNFRFSVTLDF